MASSFNVAMGKVLRELRVKTGISQSVVGQAIGVSYQQISKIEAGTNALAACYFPKIAALLGVSVAELYDRVGVKNAYRAAEAA